MAANMLQCTQCIGMAIGLPAGIPPTTIAIYLGYSNLNVCIAILSTDLYVQAQILLSSIADKFVKVFGRSCTNPGVGDKQHF